MPAQRHVASRLVLDAFAAGLPVRDIYLHVFQPAQREVGRLWQLNQITVAEEHYCTAATQLIMSQLYPHVFASEKHDGTLVATCVAGDPACRGVAILVGGAPFVLAPDLWKKVGASATASDAQEAVAAVRHLRPRDEAGRSESSRGVLSAQ